MVEGGGGRRQRLKKHKYRNWKMEDWKMVIWSDETKIQLIGSDGHQWACLGAIQVQSQFLQTVGGRVA